MTPQSGHVDSLIAHVRATGFEPGEVRHVEVRHDDDCPFFDGNPCSCNAEIETGVRVDRKYGSDGEHLPAGDECADCGADVPINAAFAVNRCTTCAIRAGREERARS